MASVAQGRKAGFPPQIRYIIGNEACERFSYYGMRSILVIFMVQYLAMDAAKAKSTYHLFITANYFLPLFGAYLADRFIGKYNTIFWLSLVYCLGHGVLAAFETENGMYWGLGLIAVGAGGIKPCVSAFVGDQFNQSNKHLLNKVFELFYFSINFGSFFSTLLIPWILPKYGPGVAFGIPGILMALATLIYWMGRKQYVHVPPTGKEGGVHFFSVITHGLTHLKERKAGGHWLDTAKAKFGEDRVEGAKAALGVFKVFIWVAAFWALFEQQGSTWTLQAAQMNPNFFGIHLEASQVQALNPIMVMALIPLFSFFVYPMIEKMGIKVTPLRKMSVGMALTGLSFVIVGLLQIALDSGNQLSIGWQILPYLVITAAEVMVSITGLEFAYTQAPPAMKSTIMSFWLLTVAVGNFFTAIVSGLNPFQGSMEFFFYAGLMFVVAAIFIFSTLRYKERNYVQGAH